MTTSNQRFDAYKLETEFKDDLVIHTTDKLRISTWKKEREIGSGGFGSVWLQKEQGGQLRAVKELRRDKLPKAGFSGELIALVETQEFDHLFVNFFGWYENTEYIFLAMEYIEHGDLGQYILDNREKAKSETKNITRQVLLGVEVLHEKSICHRDLKPQNILITNLDPIRVKIVDFGVAKETINSTARTGWGTNGYCAPEVLKLIPRSGRKGERSNLSYALDIWSLGSLVHKLLTFQIPFASTDSESDSDTGVAIGSRETMETTDIGSLAAYCRGTLEFPVHILQDSQVDEVAIAFVESLLAPNPADRPTATTLLQSPWLPPQNPLLLELLAKIQSPASSIESLRSLIDPSTRGKLFQLAVGHIATINTLFDKKINIGARINNQPVLKWAQESGQVDLVKLFLECGHEKEEFHEAITSGEIDALKLLFMQSDQDIINSRCDSTGRSALQEAARGGRIDIVKLLLENKAHVNAAPLEDDFTALQAASRGGYIDIVKLLLENEASVNATAARYDGRTALQAAAGGGHIDIVKLLLDKKADVNATAAEYNGRTALQAAAEGGHIDIVKLLLDNKADVNAPAAEYNGRTALQAADESGHIDIVKLLLVIKAGVDVTARREDINTLKLFIDHLNAEAGDSGCKVLQAAAGGGNIEIVKLLLDNKHDVNATTGHSCRAALQEAAGGGHIDIVKLLLDNNADVNATAEHNGRTALQAASGGGHIDIVKLLLDKKADVNTIAIEHIGLTALQEAAGGGHIDIVKLLLDNEADVNIAAARYKGRTALQAAAGGGHTDIVKLLLDNKADVNATATYFMGRTALQAAAGGGHIEIIKLLLDNKADVNAAAVVLHGRTALQAAAECGHIGIVEVLLKHNADVNGPPSTYAGITAMKAATIGGHTVIVEILEDASRLTGKEPPPS